MFIALVLKALFYNQAFTINMTKIINELEAVGRISSINAFIVYTRSIPYQ